MTHPRPFRRNFLLLQGPHGPFFHALAGMLRQAGCRVWRAGFNAGDRAFWPDAESYIAHTGSVADWPAHLDALIQRLELTDIVLYGDARPVHAAAVRAARAAGLTVHVFEEGYLRTYWITYERGGSNGNSRLMQLSLGEIRAALGARRPQVPDPPARWGDMRQHIFYGALYHAMVLAGHRRYRNMAPHRGVSVAAELRLYLRRLAGMPLHSLERARATRRIRRGGFPYHLALLQLEHDASFQNYSPFSSMTEFLELCVRDFAAGAPHHHHLVFKAHPLEDGRVPLRTHVRRIARAHGVAARVHFVRGGKLAALLDQARSAVTVNSTSGQQALLRGLPIRVFGEAVYAKPEFVSDQPLAAFFAAPRRPDLQAYRDFRHYLLETSQIPGGFYSAQGRQRALRRVVDLMLATMDPYDMLRAGRTAPRAHLAIAM